MGVRPPANPRASRARAGDLTKRHFMMPYPPAREVIEVYPPAGKGFSYEYSLGR